MPEFLLAQLVGGLVGLGLVRALYPTAALGADDAVVPHHGTPAPTTGPARSFARKHG